MSVSAHAGGRAKLAARWQERTGAAFPADAARPMPAQVSWHMLGSPFAVEIAAGCGAHAVLIDCQHGPFTDEALRASLRAAQGLGALAFVRVAANTGAGIAAVLDAGADGVVVPMVNTGADARAAVEAALYPPIGNRSFGPYRAEFVPGMGADTGLLNDRTLVIGQIETGEAVENLDEILAASGPDCPGLDGVLVGPNDLALSLTGARTIDAPQVMSAIATIAGKARGVGTFSWIFCNSADYAVKASEHPWDVLTVGTDAGLLKAAFRDAFGAA
ncbi:MAG: aldolase/citrate lyase family protein [Pseudomonadota bacterium]